MEGYQLIVVYHHYHHAVALEPENNRVYDTAEKESETAFAKNGLVLGTSRFDITSNKALFPYHKQSISPYAKVGENSKLPVDKVSDSWCLIESFITICQRKAIYQHMYALKATSTPKPHSRNI